MVDGANERWAALNALGHLSVYESRQQFERRKRSEIEAIHPGNALYQPAGTWVDSDFDAVEYAKTDDRLHERMTEIARNVYIGQSKPPDYPQNGIGDTEFLEKIGTLYTCQNPDWYGPYYFCCIAVIERYLRAELLLGLQQVLDTEFPGWFIEVILCQDASFGGDDKEVAVFPHCMLVERWVWESLPPAE